MCHYVPVVVTYTGFLLSSRRALLSCDLSLQGKTGSSLATRILSVSISTCDACISSKRLIPNHLGFLHRGYRRPQQAQTKPFHFRQRHPFFISPIGVVGGFAVKKKTAYVFTFAPCGALPPTGGRWRDGLNIGIESTTHCNRPVNSLSRVRIQFTPSQISLFLNSHIKNPTIINIVQEGLTHRGYM